MFDNDYFIHFSLSGPLLFFIKIVHNNILYIYVFFHL